MKTLTIELDEQLFEKLNKALDIQNENLDSAFLKFVEKYVEAAYQKLYDYIEALGGEKFMPKDTPKVSISYVNNDLKGASRIPRWAHNPQQYNHKIIRAFLQLEKEYKTVSVEMLERRCLDKEHFPEVYVPKFSGNFASMKTDEGKSHGKIFVEEYGTVTIWEKARSAIEEYRLYFE